MAPEWAEAYLKSIDERLGRLDIFMTHDCPQRHKETEHRLTAVEVRIYLLCIVISLLAPQAAHWLRTVF